MAGFMYRAPPPNVGRFKAKGPAASTYFTVPELRYVSSFLDCFPSLLVSFFFLLCF